MPPLVLFGSEGNALAVRDLLRDSAGEPLFDIRAFVDDFTGGRGETRDGVPVVSFSHWERTYRDLPMLVAVGAPLARRTLVARVTAAGGRFATCVDPASFDAGIRVGIGSFLTPGIALGAKTIIGAHVHAYPFVSVAADCTIGDYVTLCPAAVLEGAVAIGEGAFVGANATLHAAPGTTLRIGANAVIGAGAVVLDDVPPGITVVGNPAVRQSA